MDNDAIAYIDKHIKSKLDNSNYISIPNCKMVNLNLKIESDDKSKFILFTLV